MSSISWQGKRQINDAATTSNINRTPFAIDQTTNRVYSQADVNQPDFTQRQIRYDLAGNQTHDNHTSSNAYRVYDAENRMVYSNVGTGAVQSTYTYDTDGKRVRTLINNTETWFIYGMDGELLAEYGQGQTPVLPTKEYGYRNGELLIVAEAPTAYELVARHSGRCADVVYMWTHNGAPLVQYDCSGTANQHFRIEAVGGGYYRLMAEHANKSVEIEGISYAHGARVVQWDYVGGHNQQWSIDVTDGGYVRLIARHSGLAMEVSGGPGATHNGADLVQWGYYGGTGQQWKLRGVGNSNTVKWLVNDHLGTPRMIADGTGSLAGITRRDYLPFGEELTTQGGRTQSQGYGTSDNVRQGYAGYEEDDETGLNFAQARYQSPMQGRFTSVDPFDPVSGLQGAGNTEAAKMEFLRYIGQPQNWNKYAYCLNNPLRNVDPTGEAPKTIVKLNIVWERKTADNDNQGFADEGAARKAAQPYLDYLRKAYGSLDIDFDVSFAEGTAYRPNSSSEAQIDPSKKMDGALNVFLTSRDPNAMGAAWSRTNGDIFLNVRANGHYMLAHEVAHPFGLNHRGGHNYTYLGAEIDIETSLYYMSRGRIKEGADWFDDYRTIRPKREFKCCVRGLGGVYVDIYYKPTAYDILRVGARKFTGRN